MEINYYFQSKLCPSQWARRFASGNATFALQMTS